MERRLTKPRLALVYGSFPRCGDLESLAALSENYQLVLISFTSIIDQIKDSYKSDLLQLLPLTSYKKNSNLLYELESVLSSFDVVLLKERTSAVGLQVVKAKLAHNFLLVVTVDNWAIKPCINDPHLNNYRHHILSNADYVIVYGSYAQKMLLFEGVKKDKIIKINLAVKNDYCFLMPIAQKFVARQRLGVAEGQYAIVSYYDHHVDEKLDNLFYAVSYLDRCCQHLGGRIKLFIIASKGQEEEYRRLLADLNLQARVSFLPFTYNSLSTVVSFVDAAYYAFMSTKNFTEGNPYRLLLSMFNKVPIITNSSPIVSDVIGNHRLSYFLGSFISLSNAIRKSLLHKQLINDIVEKNYNKIKSTHSWYNMSAKLKQSLLNTTKIATQKPKAQTTVWNDLQQALQAKNYLSAISLLSIVEDSKSILASSRVHLYRVMGDCFIKSNNYQQAKNYYLKALRINKSLVLAHIGLGAVYLTQKKYELATISFGSAHSHDNKSNLALFGLALSSYGSNKYNDAMSQLIKLLSYDPDHKLGLHLLLRVSSHLKTFSFVMQALKAYLQRNVHDTPFRYCLGDILLQHRLYDQIITLMKPILAANPQDHKAQLLINEAKNNGNINAKLLKL